MTPPVEPSMCMTVVPSDVYIGNIETVTTAIELLDKGIVLKTTHPCASEIVLKWSCDIKSIKCCSVNEDIDVPVNGHYIFIESNLADFDGFSFPTDGTSYFDPGSSDYTIKYIAIKWDTLSPDFLSFYLQMTSKCATVTTITSLEAVSKFLSIKFNHSHRTKQLLASNSNPDAAQTFIDQVVHHRISQQAVLAQQRELPPPVVVKSEPLDEAADEVTSTNTINEPVSSQDTIICGHASVEESMLDESMEVDGHGSTSTDTCEPETIVGVFHDPSNDREETPPSRPVTRPSNRNKTFCEFEESTDDENESLIQKVRRSVRRKMQAPKQILPVYYQPLMDFVTQNSTSSSEASIPVKQEPTSTVTIQDHSLTRNVVNIANSDESSEEEPPGSFSDDEPTRRNLPLSTTSTTVEPSPRLTRSALNGSVINPYPSDFIRKLTSNTVYFGDLKCRYKEICFYESKFVIDLEQFDICRVINIDGIESIGVSNSPPYWLITTKEWVATLTVDRFKAKDDCPELRGDFKEILIQLDDHFPKNQGPYPSIKSRINNDVVKQKILNKRISRIKLDVQVVHFGSFKAPPLLVNFQDGHIIFKTRLKSFHHKISLHHIKAVDYSHRPSAVLVLKLTNHAIDEIIKLAELSKYTSDLNIFRTITITTEPMDRDKWDRVITFFKTRKTLFLNKV